jgi:hypothetical protein
MSKDQGKKQQTEAKPISRREFALGSMAILGAYSGTEDSSIPPLSEEAKAMKLEIADDVQSYLETRHILDDDIKRVIDHAEKTGEKLYRPGSDRFLSKLRVRQAYFYVEYSPTEKEYRIHTAYTHRFLLAGDR